jgi:hypothetical protein
MKKARRRRLSRASLKGNSSMDNSGKVSVPYLNPTVVQAELKGLLTFIAPVVVLIPGPWGDTAVAALQALAGNTALLTEVCNVINKFTGATPPAA